MFTFRRFEQGGVSPLWLPACCFAALTLIGCNGVEGQRKVRMETPMQAQLIPSVRGSDPIVLDSQLALLLRRIIETQEPTRWQDKVPVLPRWKFELNEKSYSVLRGTIWNDADEEAWIYNSNPVLLRMSQATDHFFLIPEELKLVLNAAR